MKKSNTVVVDTWVSCHVSDLGRKWYLWHINLFESDKDKFAFAVLNCDSEDYKSPGDALAAGEHYRDMLGFKERPQTTKPKSRK